MNHPIERNYLCFQVQHETVQTNFGCTCELMKNWLLEGGY